VNNADNIFSQPLQSVADFSFDETVADVFPDMIQRSVPGYQSIIHTIGEVAGTFVKPDTHVYDLGCSLGAASLSVARACKADSCHIHAIDSSTAMIERCQQVISRYSLPNPIELHCDLAQNVEITNASMVVMNFTLQFIEPSQRQALLQKIYDGLNPGGVFLLSEKIKHPTAPGNDLISELHLQFKRRNGYSELEISQKRAALENVMLIDTYADHEKRLKTVGFSDVVMWFKCYNFMSLIAIK
jgi:tRNA (cmo5U34)-methyltransferase